MCVCINISIYTYICVYKERDRETTYLLNNHNSGYYDLKLSILCNETFSYDGLITLGQKLPLDLP